MRRAHVIGFVCVLSIVLAGCVSGGLQGGNGDAGPSETTNRTTTAPDCVSPERGDGAAPRCLIEEHPFDLRVRNWDSDHHNVSVHVVRNGSTSVLSETVHLGVSSRTEPLAVEVYEDVFDRPGTYRIDATLDNTTTASTTWNASERNLGEGGTKWHVYVTREGELTIESADYS